MAWDFSVISLSSARDLNSPTPQPVARQTGESGVEAALPSGSVALAVPAVVEPETLDGVTIINLAGLPPCPGRVYFNPPPQRGRDEATSRWIAKRKDGIAWPNGMWTDFFVPTATEQDKLPVGAMRAPSSTPQEVRDHVTDLHVQVEPNWKSGVEIGWVLALAGDTLLGVYNALPEHLPDLLEDLGHNVPVELNDGYAHIRFSS